MRKPINVRLKIVEPEDVQPKKTYIKMGRTAQGDPGSFILFGPVARVVFWGGDLDVVSKDVGYGTFAHLNAGGLWETTRDYNNGAPIVGVVVEPVRMTRRNMATLRELHGEPTAD